MAVKSYHVNSNGQKEPDHEPEPPRGSGPWKGIITAVGWVGLWLAVGSFGGAVWAINGGFSVLGLEVIATSFNSAGRVFWAGVSTWTFTVPNVEEAQPIVPWAGVVSASLLQVVVLLLRLLKSAIPRELLVAAVVLSLYDYGTTGFGLYTVEWAKRIGAVPTALIALALTFTLEFVVALLLRRLIAAVRR